MHPEAPDPGQVAAGYPRVDLPPAELTEQTDESYRFALDTTGLLLDTEPVTHDAGDPEPFHSDPSFGGRAVSPQMPAHMLARGRNLVGQHEEPMMRAGDEEPRTERWEQGEINHGSTLAALRGDNSLPENNPEGFRIGWSVKRYYHRRFAQDRWVHTERWWRPMVAARAAASPTMQPAESNRYTSPFAWRSFYGTKLAQLPVMRRQPPESWSLQESDGTEQESVIPADWVIG
jgi:hypothetical protein